jgi:hypothetical protein
VVSARNRVYADELGTINVARLPYVSLMHDAGGD